MSDINRPHLQRQDEEEEAGVFRLPRHFLPRRYDLFFAPRPAEEAFVGSAVVTIAVAASLPVPTRRVTLHALQLRIDPQHVTLAATAADGEAEGQHCLAVYSVPADETVTLEFAVPLPNGVGDTFALRFSHFSGAIQKSKVSRGLFFSNTYDGNFLATHFEPTNARRLFPCFDEPPFRAVFQITVEFDGRYMIVSGTQPVREEIVAVDEDVFVAFFGPVASTTPSHGGGGGNTAAAGAGASASTPPLLHTAATGSLGADEEATTACQSLDGSGSGQHPYFVRRITFDETPQLSTSAIGFSTGKFHIVEKEASRHRLLCRVLFPADLQVNQGWYALDLLTKAVDFFDDYYDFPLPLQKLDLIGLRCFCALGMENWGMITMHQEYLLVDESTPLERRQRIARLIGHEVAHQWIGDWATIAWWKFLWLKEGICRYLEFMFVNAVFPNWLIWDEFLTQILDDVLVLDAQPDKTHPVQYCNSKPRCIDGSFDTISYGKGASILRMLFSLLGRDRLQKAAHCLLQRSSSRVLDDKVFLDCICDKECAPAEYEDVAAVLRYTERSGHPLLYVEHLESACRVTQYESPDLRQGILPAYVKAQQQQRCDGRSPVDLMTPRYTRSFAWDPEKFLKRSDYMVPVSIMEVRPGVSSFARPYYMRASRETITGAPGQLIYFNYRGTGVLRCDYDTATWLRIFEISPFLSSEDRTVITMTLFRFRSMHIGHDSSEPSDRCTLLLEWLLLLSQRSFTNASQWKYITEHMERMAYIVRDYPCWGIFSQFVCTIYAPLVQRGVVSFAVQEKTVSFASQTNLSRQTVLHILQVLAICRSSMIIDESRQLVDWALASVLPNLAMSSSAAAYRAVTFDISDDVDTTAASIAMQCLTEHGDMKAWWTLACVLARLLGHPLRRAAVELRCEEVDVHFSHLGEKGERRWINMVAPAVFALDSSSALPFLVGVLQHFTRLNTPIAKAILRNKRLITWLFEAPEAGEMIPRLGVIRRLLVMHVAAFCSDSNLIALMKSFVAALPEANSNNVVDAVPGPAAGHPNLLVNAVAAMETNYVWIDYCCDHYLAFLSMKQSSHAWVSMHAASPGSNADIYAMDRDGVSI